MTSHPQSQPQPWADHAETHISAVFFAGEHVYKQLKPLKTAFLDHSTIEQRAEALRQEHELNSRLAPDVYIGVAPVAVAGTTIDHVLVMKRMPAERTLSLLAGADGPPSPDLDKQLKAVARAVAAFHEQLGPDDEAAAIAAPEAERQRWINNLDEMAGDVDAEILGRIRQEALAFLDHREPLFTERAAAGLCRDGHGDLLAADIFCLDDGPRILDCLAFDASLRKGDVLADIAFLVMDIERLSGPRPAQRLLRWYQEFTNEHHPASLAHFYVAYRALVRAKVTLLRVRQDLPADEEQQAQAEANAFLAQCIDHLRRARPRVVLVGGGPGTGKSTVATIIADTMAWSMLGSDELRKELSGVDRETHAFAKPDQGIYKPEVTTETYTTLCDQASVLLQRGESVVLDASWRQSQHREMAREMAEACGAQIIELQCQLDEAIAKERIVRRMASPWTVSDATTEVVDFFTETTEPWPEATHLDTEQALHTVRANALTAVLRLGDTNGARLP